jgi:hypothetical protein
VNRDEIAANARMIVCLACGAGILYGLALLVGVLWVALACCGVIVWFVVYAYRLPRWRPW